MYEQMHFTVDNTSRLTGLSPRQLRSWRDRGIFTPQLIDHDGEQHYSRFYTFRDLVGLRILSLLRHDVAYDELRRVQPWLREHSDKPWADLRLHVRDRRICFVESGTVAEPRHHSAPTEQAHVIDVGLVAQELAQDVEDLRRRGPDEIGRVTRYRGVQGGDWVLAGTRIPTKSVWQMDREGYTIEEILAQFPDLTPVDVHAAVQHEAETRDQRAMEKRL